MTRRKAVRKPRSTLTPWLLLIVFFVAELLVFSWCRVQYVQTGYDIDQVKQERRQLIALHHELQVEEARLRSPERIRRLAQKRGLVMPDSSHVVVLP
ncbi:MAG: cell division protein FtsL [Deltaproteobacteria bacterium]|nr:cell division protein FtsL [Deltaproteobacteria bacterium]